MKTGYYQKYIIIFYYHIIIIVIIYDIILIKEYKNVTEFTLSALMKRSSSVGGFCLNLSVRFIYSQKRWKTSRTFHVLVSIKVFGLFQIDAKMFLLKGVIGSVIKSVTWAHFFYQFLLECLCWARLTEPVISPPQRHRPVSVRAVRPCEYSVKSVLMQPPTLLMKAQVDLRQWETGTIDPRSNFWDVLCAAPECQWTSFNI